VVCCAAIVIWKANPVQEENLPTMCFWIRGKVWQELLLNRLQSWVRHRTVTLTVLVAIVVTHASTPCHHDQNALEFQPMHALMLQYTNVLVHQHNDFETRHIRAVTDGSRTLCKVPTLLLTPSSKMMKIGSMV
jgi:hypothetical protein